MSSTASVHSAKEEPTAERAQPAETVDEYEDAEKNFQPRSPKFWMIIIGMYLSIFLVALVTSLSLYNTSRLIYRAYMPVGSHNYCNGHSTYY